MDRLLLLKPSHTANKPKAMINWTVSRSPKSNSSSTHWANNLVVAYVEIWGIVYKCSKYKPISRNSITSRCSLMQRWDDWGNVGSSPHYIVWSLLKLQMPYPNYFLQETVSNLHGYSFLLNILDVPYWRYSVLKFGSTTQQVACDFREANEELQLQ